MEHIWSRHYDYSEWREKNQHLTESQAKAQYENELFYFKQYRQTLVEKQKRDELFSPPEPYKETPHVFKKSRGPAPPVPPPTIPSGYSLWFDASDENTITRTETGNVRVWKSKTNNINYIAPTAGAIDYSDGITYENNGVKFNEFTSGVNTYYPYMSGSIIGDVSSVSYGEGSLTIFAVGQIHSKDIVNGAIADSYNAYGRALGVTTNAQTGSWMIGFRAGANNSNATFRPQLSVQVGTNSYASGLQASTAFIETGSGIFACEFQISKSIDDVDARVVAQQGSEIEKTDHTSLDILDTIRDSNDQYDNGLAVTLHQASGEAFNAEATWFSFIHYPELLTQDKTQGVYDWINHYYGTNFNATSSYI